ncbi:hypothetical protein ACB347_28655, partial [Klebsiella quasipneumoniae]
DSDTVHHYNGVIWNPVPDKELQREMAQIYIDAEVAYSQNAETGLPLAEWCQFPRYALVRILMHAVKTEPARFWRVFGWFVALFTGFPSETP